MNLWGGDKNSDIFTKVVLLKMALSQKRMEDFYFSQMNIPNHYPEQKI